MAIDFKYALSHSRLSDYLQCPRKFHHKYVIKTPNFTVQDSSPALTRGANVHKALENYIIKVNAGEKGIAESSLPEVESTKPLIMRFFGAYDSVTPEQQISVNRDWKQVDWFAKDSYYRAIYDMVAVSSNRVAIIDFKTGKFKDYSEDGPGQLELSATIAMNMWPNVKVVDTMYVYVDHKKTICRSFKPDKDKDYLVEHFVKIHAKINMDEEWLPTQNEYCKFCPATKLQCQFSRKL